MSVHVSIHDVTPAFASEIEDAIELTRAHGIRPSLLVVPNFHGQSPLERAPTFVDRLQALAKEGHEILLHGYHHHGRLPDSSNLGGSPTAGPLHDFWYQRIVSFDEAEFAAISRREASRRIEQGLADFAQLGLSTTGFVAPAWAMMPWLLPILASHGIRYTEDHLRTYDLVTSQSSISVVLNYATRSPLRIASTIAYCRVMRLLSPFLPVRIAIHPGDVRVRVVRRELDALLDELSGDASRLPRDLEATGSG